MKQAIKERIDQINQGILPSGYKQTSVGICPIDWQKGLKLKNYCLINPKTDKLKDNFVYIDLESVIKGKLYKKEIVNIKNAPSRAQRVLKKNDVLFSMVRPYQKNNYFYKDIFNNQVVASTGYAQLRNDIPEFLYQIVNNEIFCIQVIEKCTGTNYPAISSNDLGNILINIPKEKYEQQKIADVLTTWDNAVELQEKKIEKLQEKKKALMQKLLTPKPDWKKEELEKAIDFYNGYSFESKNYIANGNYKIITISAVKDNEFFINDSTPAISELPLDIQEHQILKIGDILISMTGNVGRICMVNKENCLLNQRVGKIAVKKNYNKDYIFYVLQTHNFIEKMKILAQGAAQDNMSVKDVYKYKFYFPENKTTQEKIANIFIKIDKKITLETNLLEQYKEQRRALMQLLLTGIVRV